MTILAIAVGVAFTLAAIALVGFLGLAISLSTCRKELDDVQRRLKVQQELLARVTTEMAAVGNNALRVRDSLRVFYGQSDRTTAAAAALRVLEKWQSDGRSN